MPFLKQIITVHTRYTILFKPRLLLPFYLSLGFRNTFSWFYHKNAARMSLTQHPCYMPGLSPTPLFDNRNITWQNVGIMKIPIIDFYAAQL